MTLNEGERLDDLEYKGLKIIQRKDMYCFTSDSVLLANLSAVRSGDRVLDMGTGSGIIAILLAAKTKASKVIGIDIQPVMTDMARRSVELNNLSDRVEILNMDIADAPNYFGYGSFDIIVTNPPYYKKGSGEKSAMEHINISKAEIKITLSEIIECASKLIKFGGKFYIINKAERLGEVISLMYNLKLTPKRLINILPKAGKDIDTVILEGKKGANDGMKVSTLTVYNSDNSMTVEAKKLYCKE